MLTDCLLKKEQESDLLIHGLYCLIQKLLDSHSSENKKHLVNDLTLDFDVKHLSEDLIQAIILPFYHVKSDTGFIRKNPHNSGDIKELIQFYQMSLLKLELFSKLKKDPSIDKEKLFQSLNILILFGYNFFTNTGSFTPYLSHSAGTDHNPWSNFFVQNGLAEASYLIAGGISSWWRKLGRLGKHEGPIQKEINLLCHAINTLIENEAFRNFLIPSQANEQSPVSKALFKKTTKLLNLNKQYLLKINKKNNFKNSNNLPQSLTPEWGEYIRRTNPTLRMSLRNYWNRDNHINSGLNNPLLTASEFSTNQRPVDNQNIKLLHQSHSVIKFKLKNFLNNFTLENFKIELNRLILEIDDDHSVTLKKPNRRNQEMEDSTKLKLQLLVFKNQNFRGTFYQHLLLKIGSRNPLLSKNVNETFGELFPSEIDNIPAFDIDKEFLPSNLISLYHNIKSSSSYKIEKHIQDAIYSISKDRYESAQIFHVLSLGISNNIEIDKSEKISLCNTIENYLQIAKSGNGPLAPICCKRDLFWSDFTGTLFYFGFTLIKVFSTLPEVAANQALSFAGGGIGWAITSTLFPFTELFSYGKTTAYETLENINQTQKESFENLSAPEYSIETPRTTKYFPKFEFINFILNAKNDSISLNEIFITDEVPPKPITILEFLKQFPNSDDSMYLSAFFESHHSNKRPLIFDFLEKIKKTEANEFLSNYYINYKNIINNLKENYLNNFSFVDNIYEDKSELESFIHFFQSIPSEIKFKKFISKEKKIAGSSKEQSAFLFLKAKAFLLNLKQNDLNFSQSKSYDICKRILKELISAEVEKSSLGLQLQSIPKAKYIMDKGLIRSAGAFQWGAFSSWMIQCASENKIFWFVLAETSAPWASIFCGAAVVCLAVSSAGRLTLYAYADGKKYSKNNFEYQFIEKHLEESFQISQINLNTKPIENETIIPIYAALLNKVSSEDKIPLYNSIAKEIIGDITEVDKRRINFADNIKKLKAIVDISIKEIHDENFISYVNRFNSSIIEEYKSEKKNLQKINIQKHIKQQTQINYTRIWIAGACASIGKILLGTFHLLPEAKATIYNWAVDAITFAVLQSVADCAVSWSFWYNEKPVDSKDESFDEPFSFQKAIEPECTS